MNQIRKRVGPHSPVEIEACDRIERQQSDASIREIFGSLKDETLVRWKDSIKLVLGLTLAEGAE
jgi:hypothetical protein